MDEKVYLEWLREKAWEREEGAKESSKGEKKGMGIKLYRQNDQNFIRQGRDTLEIPQDYRMKKILEELLDGKPNFNQSEYKGPWDVVVEMIGEEKSSNN